MRIIKRIIAIIILLPAILGMLGMIAGMVGSWALNNTITQVGVDVLNAGSDFVGFTLDVGTQVETLLTDAQSVVTEVEGEIERVGDDFSQTDIMDNIAQLLDTDLETIVNDIESFFASIQQTALALADALDAVRGLPLADDTESVNQNVFRDVAADIDALSGEINDLLALVERGKDELTFEVVSELTTATTQINNSVSDLVAQISTVKTELTTLQNDLVEAQTTWARLIDIISIVLSIVFSFLALAFLSLASHAWAYFVKPDHTLRSLIPLERRGDETEAAKASMS